MSRTGLLCEFRFIKKKVLIYEETRVKKRTCLFSEDILPDFIIIFFGNLIRKVLQLPETPRRTGKNPSQFYQIK